ncbi:MAG: hypothetical protein KGY81_10175 [Phycisphaerae bacterium]|nr:hypothetical protein [Phycisphaerae bacterium]
MLIIAYWLASVLGHLEVSLWLVERRESDILGSYKLIDFLPYAGALLLAVVLIWQARRAWRGCNRTATLAAWAVWLSAVIAADRFLIYSFSEYLHYPQYALLAWMMARFVDPNRTTFAVGPILLAVTLLGIADEALQYTWITISYSNYLDFNDFLLNLLGGIAGLLLHYGFAPGPWSRNPVEPVGRGCVPDAPNVVRTKAGADQLSPEGVSRRPETLRSVGLRFANPTYEARTSARYGLLGFAWLGTGMLIAVAALQTASTDPQLLQPIERQPSYNAWIPGPHAGRYYVLDPVTGTLILVGLGALASAAPIMRRASSRPNLRSPEMLKES